MFHSVKTVSVTKSSPIVTQNELIVFNPSLHELCPHVHKTSDMYISNVSSEQSSHLQQVEGEATMDCDCMIRDYTAYK